MKALRNISLTVVLLASLSACVENDPTYNVYPSDDVAFTYHITNEGYELDYLVGSTIQFTNTSAISGTCTWDFGDGETSTDVNPTHTYSLPGQYEVKLTIIRLVPCLSTTLNLRSSPKRKMIEYVSSTTSKWLWKWPYEIRPHRKNRNTHGYCPKERPCSITRK